MLRMPPIAGISAQRARAPRTGRGRLRIDRKGVPIVDIAAGKLRTRTFRAECIAWGVARAAMRQPFDQIGAAIPLRALRRVRLVGSVAKKQQLPAGDHKPLVEWK